MFKYRVKLIVNEYEWGPNDKVENQLIVLFKPEQTLGKNLSYMFSNFSELSDEDKVYASTIADDLFSIEEILELMCLFLTRKDIQIMIYHSTKIPFTYDKKSCGISVTPMDRKTRHISFRNVETLSFPLNGFVRRGNYLIGPNDLNQ